MCKSPTVSSSQGVVGNEVGTRTKAVRLYIAGKNVGHLCELFRSYFRLLD